MKVNNKGKRTWQVIPGIMLFVICIFSVYATWMNGVIFVDEQDVFYGGYNVVMSGDLYVWYPSQHMPVSYYLAAIGTLLGARTIYQFRLFFYGIMTLIWLSLYLRHRKAMNKVFLIALPFIYLFQLPIYSFATTMISDHWQGIGLIIILLELLRYGKTKKITVPTTIFVSVGILLSFGSAFLSAYPILIVFLGVIGMQIHAGKERKGIGRLYIHEDMRLILICIAPFAVLIAWYAVTGTLQAFIQSVYTMNVENYSRYASNYSNNAAESLWSILPNWISYLVRTIGQIFADPQTGLMALIQVCSLAVFTIVLWKKNRILAVTLLLTVLIAGVRGYTGFHSSPYLAACAVPIAGCIGQASAGIRKKRFIFTGTSVVLASGALIILAIPTLQKIQNLADFPNLVSHQKIPETNQDLLDIITDPGERIHVGDISMTSEKVMAYNLRLDRATPASSNPWFYEIYGKEELDYLKENHTKVVLLDPDGYMWQYCVRDYAADLVKYVEENYVQIAEQMWIYRETMPEIYSRLKEKGYGLVRTDLSTTGVIPWLTQKPGELDEQTFIAAADETTACWIQMDTYPESNRAGLTISVVEPETETVIGSAYVAWNQMEGSGWTRIPVSASLTPGKQYVLRIRTDDDASFVLLRIYRTLDDTDTEDYYAFSNGLRMNFCYSIKLEYAVKE